MNMTHDFSAYLKLAAARQQDIITPAQEIRTAAWLNDVYALKNQFSNSVFERVTQGRAEAEGVLAKVYSVGISISPKKELGTLLLMAGKRYYPEGAGDIVSTLQASDLPDAIRACAALVKGDIWVEKTYKNKPSEVDYVEWALVFDLEKQQVVHQEGEICAPDKEDLPTSVRAVVRPTETEA